MRSGKKRAVIGTGLRWKMAEFILEADCLSRGIIRRRRIYLG